MKDYFKVRNNGALCNLLYPDPVGKMNADPCLSGSTALLFSLKVLHSNIFYLATSSVGDPDPYYF